MATPFYIPFFFFFFLNYFEVKKLVILKYIYLRCKVYRMIEEMEKFKFVDKLTRAVMIDMTFFHPGMSYFVLSKLASPFLFLFFIHMKHIIYCIICRVFCLVRLLFQLPSTGGVMPISQVMVTRLYEYVNGDDFIRFCMEMGVLFFVLSWSIHEVRAIKRGPKVKLHHIITDS